mmetsp:Transcript_21766/g.65238  ORF Transcript_21766/g.65238 Transcript_21766/m.65238 type:complete len:389 (-) Transcript_21766:936-2102(-)
MPDMEKKSTSANSDMLTARSLCARRSRPQQHRDSASDGSSPPSAAAATTGTPSTASTAASSSATAASLASARASAASTTAKNASSSRGCSRLKSATPSLPSSPPATSASRAAKTSPTRPEASGTSRSQTRFLRSGSARAPGTRAAARALASPPSPSPRSDRRHAAPNLALRCSGVPSARSWPRAMMAVRVQSASASSMECVVSTTARPTMALRSTAQRRRRDTGSRPADGSSRSTTVGSPTSAHATHSLRFMPPDRRDARRPGTCESSTSSKNWRTMRRRSAPRTRRPPRARRRSRNKSKCSAHVRVSYRVSVCVTTPRWDAAPAKSSSTLRPRTHASPAEGKAARITTAIADVLPAPLAPSSPKISPRSTVRLRFSTATVSCLEPPP